MQTSLPRSSAWVLLEELRQLKELRELRELRELGCWEELRQGEKVRSRENLANYEELKELRQLNTREPGRLMRSTVLFSLTDHLLDPSLRPDQFLQFLQFS